MLSLAQRTSTTTAPDCLMIFRLDLGPTLCWVPPSPSLQGVNGYTCPATNNCQGRQLNSLRPTPTRWLPRGMHTVQRTRITPSTPAPCRQAVHDCETCLEPGLSSS
ncbi:hypothetical protein CERZMDRAFT_89297 [Cercospora zeae-maydis SCOH1-5]|uniref:Uncharacterized protein n=1 Tax=Cercospora zeae-maydis SCOH1-5 TaxID=717836 RepID=A0A6A6EW02_9PEZI|nr:hypothetical protein CERZMDRAFT_89297 [Cercospora zeae-maydis SCOH1-5]